jgi:tyrosyl-tRNA synthetase
MNVDKKIGIIKSFAEEFIGEDELENLFENQEKTGTHIIAYDGFEPSGQIHIAQGLMRAITVNKLTSCGIKFKFWVADYFAMLNNKYGGDLDKIQIVGKYFIEMWKACGMDLKNVEFIWTKKFIENNPSYWKDFLKLSMNTSVKRVLKCGQIMGREESINVPASQIIYPLMQACDIKNLKADICQLGLDQRKVNMLARDIFPKMGWQKPVVISHHMLLGLQKIEENSKLIELDVNIEKSEIFDEIKISLEELPTPPKEYSTGIINTLDILGGKKTIPKKIALIKVENKDYELKSNDWKRCGKLGVKLLGVNYEDGFIRIKIKKEISNIDRKIEMKMSKSKPDTAVFMTDTNEDVERKFKKAHSIDGVVEDNPILEYFKYIIFEKFEEIEIKRPEKFGGLYKANSYKQLEEDFKNQKIKSLDLKLMCSKFINELLEPIRKYFEENKQAKELLEKVKSFNVVR